MKKILFLLIITLVVGQVSAQKVSFWTKVSKEQTANLARVRPLILADGEQYYKVDISALKNSLANVANKLSGQAGIQMFFPNANGEMEQFLVWENSNFDPALQALYPEIRSYKAIGVTDKSAMMSFSVSPIGVQTMTLRADKDAEFIEAFDKAATTYVLFTSKNSSKGRLPFNCGTEDLKTSQTILNKTGIAMRSNNSVYKTMRLALSCTGEYGTFFGGTVAGALAGMNATMTRCNGVYEKDLAVHMNMIANNNLVVYTNAATDPYDPSSIGAGTPTTSPTWNAQLQATLTSVIGESAYDIGHLFGGDGGGGNAGCIGCVCVDGVKGSGFTSPSNAVPAGDTFDIDYVVHEMGHQMGANHTFSFKENNSVNVEPGSGSTIMAYAGITTVDVQAHSDPYYTYRSILQIQNYLAGAAVTCPVTVATTNTKPVVNAGADITIPKGTAYLLTGSGSDPDGDPITFCWEENDDATTVNTTATMPSLNKTNGPNYRSLNPVSIPVRYMPAYSTIIGGAVSSTWETVSNVFRVQKFTLTVRDNVVANGQTNTDEVLVTTNNTIGPFSVSYPAAAGISWAQGSVQTITWNVNNTTTLAGSASINIKLSIDNGATWTMLSAATPNDGTEAITVPNVSATTCRILIEPTGNIYYAVNPIPFSIGYTCNIVTLSPNALIADGTAANVGGAITTSAITVPTIGTVNNMKVTFNTNHTYNGDLVVKLAHPDGTQVTLLNRTCNNPQTSGFNVTLQDGSPIFVCTTPIAGTFAPVGLLSAFNGKPTNGNWTLSAQDMYNGDTGSIISWGVDFGCVLANDSFESADSFAITPNPSNGSFTIQFNATSEKGVKISINDIQGRLIYNETYNYSGLFYQFIKLNQTQTGVYFVTIQDGDKKVVKRVIIE